MVVGTQVFDEMILAGEAIAALARAVVHRAVAEDGIVNAGLVALEICEASEGLAAAAGVAGERLSCSIAVSC